MNISKKTIARCIALCALVSVCTISTVISFRWWLSADSVAIGITTQIAKEKSLAFEFHCKEEKVFCIDEGQFTRTETGLIIPDEKGAQLFLELVQANEKQRLTAAPRFFGLLSWIICAFFSVLLACKARGYFKKAYAEYSASKKQKNTSFDDTNNHITAITDLEKKVHSSENALNDMRAERIKLDTNIEHVEKSLVYEKEQVHMYRMRLEPCSYREPDILPHHESDEEVAEENDTDTDRRMMRHP